MLSQLLKTIDVVGHTSSGLPKVKLLVDKVDFMKRREVNLF